jgi:hypothetical protein
MDGPTRTEAARVVPKAEGVRSIPRATDPKQGIAAELNELVSEG